MDPTIPILSILSVCIFGSGTLWDVFWVAWLCMVGYAVHRVWFVSTQPREVRIESSRRTEDMTIYTNLTMLILQHLGCLDHLWAWMEQSLLRVIPGLGFLFISMLSLSAVLESVVYHRNLPSS